MNNPWDIIKELEADNSRLKKEAIIRRESDADNDVFFEGVCMALDGFRTYGVKQVPKSTKDGGGMTWLEFKELVRQLEHREATGNTAKQMVQQACDESNKDQWNDWYRRILIKDLRCGVTHKTINKHSTMKVPVFECMLADDSKKHEKKLIGEVLVEPKLDGVRVVAIVDVDKDEVKMYSRNGKELYNFPKIVAQLDSMLDQMPESLVLDGEVMSDDFQTLMREIHRKEGAKTDDAILNVFDCLPLIDFMGGGCGLTITKRKQMLEDFEYPENIRLVEYVKMNLSDEDGQKQFADYNKLCIDKGYEGIMVKPVSYTHLTLPTTPYV